MKSILKFITCVSFATLLFYNKANAQGCVAIRSTGGLCTMDEHPDSTNADAGSWLFNSNNRYFRS
ncbi:hypothetical protein [Mucilaginibacter flavus]|uniref:hypothetical protein n=1 Tax=Mucilaginibacter flavus TaxID=931504 RepID=UPI0025B2C220|nr:hypothetical protein [Mucilaginibacter flavus]MDN3583312.1 hypothetical protein [Mucilaginibacter flavus]